ncbi:sterol desaturase family protein [Caenispirillum salinarum]|uniref:sterol desaturase family protein n=1 Tax=Caenispirillum salinarum TaxID=859058 RepID=UPI00384A5891
MSRRYSPLVSGAVVLGAFAALVCLERKRPLRRRMEPANRHDARNLAIAGLAALTVRLFEAPLVERLSRRVERDRLGLVPRLGLPRGAQVALGITLLDYTLYLWHMGTHRIPFLWRVHRVHHVDLDLTATTATRFHALELLYSVPWRLLQVAVIGAGPATVRLWQRLTLLSILFQHSNLRLPPRLDRALSWLVVTPRMHGIHHSDVRAEADSNWSSGLTLWDRLHGTLRLDVPQETIRIGTPAHRDPVTLGRALVLPLREGPNDWSAAPQEEIAP